MGSRWNEAGTGDEAGVAVGLGASFATMDSSSTSTWNSNASSAPIASSNIGFQLLKKHGWKEGTGLGIAEQGRLEPIEAYVKTNKRGLGADKVKKEKEKAKNAASHSDQNGKQLSKRQMKGMTKKMRKLQEFEKHLKEKEMERAIFREFWPENV